MANFIIVPAIKIVEKLYLLSLFNTFLLVVEVKYKFVKDKYIIFSRFIIMSKHSSTAQNIKKNVQHERHIKTIKVAESSEWKLMNVSHGSRMLCSKQLTHFVPKAATVDFPCITWTLYFCFDDELIFVLVIETRWHGSIRRRRRPTWGIFKNSLSLILILS